MSRAGVRLAQDEWDAADEETDVATLRRAFEQVSGGGRR